VDWTSPAQQREAALAPFMARLGLRHGEGAAQEVPSSITLGDYEVSLDPWEKGVLDRMLDGGGCEPWARVLAESLAFQVKCLSQLGQIRQLTSESPSSGLPREQMEAVLDHLITDAAVGLALLEETQRAIDQLIVSGDVGDAKKLSGLRNRIGQNVSKLKEHIGDDGFQRAENKCQGMVAPARSQHMGTSAGPGHGTTWAGRKRRQVHPDAYLEDCAEVEESAPSPVRSLVLLFCVCTVAWMVFVLPRWLEAGPHVIDLAELSHVPGVLTVMARPPSLFVTVSGPRWRDMAEIEHRQLIEEVGRVAESAGYSGAHFRMSDGGAAGVWLQKTGTQIYKNKKSSNP
jgi:hypothetical protein